MTRGCQKSCQGGSSPFRNQKPEKLIAASALARNTEEKIEMPEWDARLRNSAANAKRMLAMNGKNR